MTQMQASDGAAEAAEARGPETGFLKQPEALSPTKHGALRFDRSADGFAFARRMHLAPITIDEFPAAAAHYPIVFVGERLSPCVVMGIVREENLYVDEKGAFPPGLYVPAYFRQYPFQLAKTPEGDNDVLLFDAAAPGFSEDAGEKLFEDGKPSRYVVELYAFLSRLQTDWGRTRAFVDELRGLDMIVKRSVTVRRGGDVGAAEPFRFFTVAAEKIDDLDAAALKTLAKPGHLQAIYAQQASMHAWPRLDMRARPAA